MEGEAGERVDLIHLRRHLGAAILGVFLGTAGLPLFAPPSAAAPVVSRVSDIRAWTNEIYTRVAIDTGEEVSWQANTLRADPARGLPPRIFIDIRGAGIRDEILRKPVEIRNGLLRQVRAGRFDHGTVRVVIDLERESTYRVFALPAPFRIIVDIDGEGEIPVLPDSSGPAAAGPSPEHPDPSRATPPVPPSTPSADPASPSTLPVIPPSMESPRVAASPPSPARKPRVRVMVDPGHGGKDSGAIGPTGLKEKDVVLAI